ncbi:toll/interleukin-1 receptor domain-containing protein [Cytophagaceae bacterium ABcell3]|nr:toll/interleukin-1 receptor domain-containing protein [Cytophagaceae bacterium ABcell3]
MSVFISYSTKDSEFVTRLSTELVKRRIRVWLDKWEMQPGDSLVDKIQAGLSDSSYLLVVLSNNSINSEWCKKELNSGIMRELEEKKVVVIPIIIDDCKIPIFLKEKVYADFRKDFDEGLKSLLRPLSKFFSEHMGRSSNDEVISDYAINWGIKDDLYYMTIDIVNWMVKDKKSILLQVEINGCENATDRFMMQVKSGMGWLMKETIISMMFMNDDFRNLNILVKNDEVFVCQFKTKDIKMNIFFDVKFRAILMGEDNGNDILVNFIDFIEMLDGSRQERKEKYGNP